MTAQGRADVLHGTPGAERVPDPALSPPRGTRMQQAWLPNCGADPL